MAKLQGGTRIYGTANVDTILYVNTYFVANAAGVYSTGTINSASQSVGTNFVVNTSQLAISGITFSANGSVGTTSQVLTSNSTGGVYWGTGVSGYTGSQGNLGYTGSFGSTGYTGSVGVGYAGSSGYTGSIGTGYVGSLGYSGSIGNIGYTGSAGSGTGGGFSNGQSISVNNIVITGSLTANSSNGVTGQVLTSNGTSVYWANTSSSTLAYANATSQSFTGNGSNTVFTLGTTVTNQTNIIVSLNGLIQIPTIHYTISGTTLTFTTAPYSGSIIETRDLEGVVVSSNPGYTRTSITASASQTTFTASYNVASVLVFVNGVLLNASDYTATSGTSIVLGVAANSGDIVEIISISSSGGGSGLTLASVQTANLTAVANYIYPINTSSGPVYITLPSSPSAGQQIAITDYAGTFGANNCVINPNGGKISGVSANVSLSVAREGAALVYVDSTQGWLGYGNFVSSPVAGPYTVSYLMVAGGGGGGAGHAATWEGAGAGAGGMLTGTTTVIPQTIYNIVIGSGGPGGVTGAGSGTNGVNTTFNGLTAIGGGYGGGGNGGTVGGSGGSGGGAWYTGAGSGTSGQGNAGSNGNNGTAAGGGGGAGAAGGLSNGGAGLSSSITGSVVYYAGGGGGSPGGAGGNGGGGAGGSSTVGYTGSAGTGGGGGGGTSTSSFAGGSGGSGVVILSIPTANYTGAKTGAPTVTTSGTFTILTFNSSGSYTA